MREDGRKDEKDAGWGGGGGGGGGGERKGMEERRKKQKTKKEENEGERTTRETKTYLSQVTEGQKQRVTLEACDRAGSGKTCGKIQTRPPQSTPGEREERRRRKKKRVKNGIIKDLVGFAMHRDRLADK